MGVVVGVGGFDLDVGLVVGCVVVDVDGFDGMVECAAKRVVCGAGMLVERV